MLKITVFVLLLFLIACGKTENRFGVSLGQTQSYNPVSVDSSTAKNVSLICHALAQKNPTLGSSYVFDYSQKACSSPGSDISPMKSVLSTTLEASGGQIYFRKSDQTQIPFDYETTSTGVMGIICSNLEGLKNQIMSSSGELISFSISAQDMNGMCVNGTNQMCIIVTRHTETTPGSGVYKAQSKDWLKINLNNSQGRVGFWVERTRVTTGDCANNLQQELKIVLK